MTPRSPLLDAALVTANRQRFVNQLLPKSIAIFISNDPQATNADGVMGYRQNNGLYYLTAITQADTILVLFPDHPEEKYREMLFVQEPNEHYTKWYGHRLDAAQARERSGIQRVHWTSEFELHLHALMVTADHVYLNANEHSRAVIYTPSREARFAQQLHQRYPLHQYHRTARLLDAQRTLKQPQELSYIRHAVALTRRGFLKALQMIKPGVVEYEVEAEFTYEFIRGGSRGHAYHPIVAGGANTCILHYEENNRPLQAGDLLLMDVGAEYGSYPADMTRTVPVSGRYTPRQRQLYDAVLHIHKTLKGMLKPGITWLELQKSTEEMVTKVIVDMGVVSSKEIAEQDAAKPVVNNYYYHGFGHLLGLDVHDVGDKYAPLTAGMVITIEPGIYIAQEGIGVRIENDVLLTETGYEDLMADIPLEAEEIEELMQQVKPELVPTALHR